MKSFIFTLLLSVVSWAHPSKTDVSLFIDQQLAIEDSKLNNDLADLMISNVLLGETQFLINEPGLVYEKPLESFNDCVNSVCKLYQRKVYSKIASLRTDWIRGQNHSIFIQFIEIAISSRKTWILDSEMKPLELIEDRLVFEGVYYVPSQVF